MKGRAALSATQCTAVPWTLSLSSLFVSHPRSTLCVSQDTLPYLLVQVFVSSPYNKTSDNRNCVCSLSSLGYPAWSFVTKPINIYSYTWMTLNRRSGRQSSWGRQAHACQPQKLLPNSEIMSCQFPWVAKPFGKEEVNRNKQVPASVHQKEEAPAFRHDKFPKYAVFTPIACI